MKKTNYVCAFVALWVLSPEKHLAQGFSLALETSLQWKLDSVKQANDIQGIAAAVYYPDQGSWKGGTGFSQGAVPIVPDMKFGIASNSKLFTAVALLKLQEIGAISLDDSVGSWLPPIPHVASEITLRQLLNNTSGVFDVTNIAGYADTILSNPNRVIKTEEMLQWLQAPLFAPGMGWSYSNTNYLLAGLIFEKAADQAIEKFLRDSLLEVHGLNQTYFPIFESLPSDVARPWSNNQPIGNIPRTSLLSAAWTAGAMYSNAEDMNRWYRDLFDGKILLPTSMSEMLAFTGSARYGLGIQKVEIGGRTCYAHGGSIRGYRSFMLYDEATGAVISVLINENPASPNLVAEALLLTLTEAFSGVSVHDKMAGGGVDIYPNPTTGRIVLKPSGGEGSDVFSLVRSVSIFDQQGRLVIQQDNPDLELEVGGLARGVYWVKIQFDHGPLSRKIFVR